MVFVKPRPDEETRRCFPEAGVGRTEELAITGYELLDMPGNKLPEICWAVACLECVM